MFRKLLLVCTCSFIAGYGYTQHNIKSVTDTTARKGSHQVRTVNSKVIKLDKPVNQKNEPLQPMKTRQDTLMYLIKQHRQNKNTNK